MRNGDIILANKNKFILKIPHIIPNATTQSEIATKDIRLYLSNAFKLADPELLDGNKDVARNMFNNTIIDAQRRQTQWIWVEMVLNKNTGTWEILYT